MIAAWSASRGSPPTAPASYLIRYGIQPDKLYHHYLVRGGESSELKLFSLNHEPGYFFRIDSLNDSGITPGRETAEAP